jgi:hypothetical protein
MSNTVYTLDLEVNNATAAHESSQGILDPVIAVDPTDPNAADLEVLTSPGIGNSSAVPEASTWAMMLAGFTGLGYAAYRRRAVAATA